MYIVVIQVIFMCNFRISSMFYLDFGCTIYLITHVAWWNSVLFSINPRILFLQVLWNKLKNRVFINAVCAIHFGVSSKYFAFRIIFRKFRHFFRVHKIYLFVYFLIIYLIFVYLIDFIQPFNQVIRFLARSMTFSVVDVDWLNALRRFPIS